jgi:hypothetical protein
MYGEFKINVSRDASDVVAALNAIYPGNDLAGTLADSQFNGIYPINTFVFGVTKTDVYILISITNRVGRLDTLCHPGVILGYAWGFPGVFFRVG